MNKKLALLLLPLALVSCDSFKSKKIKSLVELTPQLAATSTESIIVDKDLPDNIFGPKYKALPFNVTKGSVISQPAFAKGMVYLVDNKGYVHAFSLKEQRSLWSQNINYNARNSNNHLGGGVTYSNGKLYITDGSNQLVILNSDNGHEIMRKEFPDLIRTKPVILDDDLVLVQTVSNHLIAYSLTAAGIAWQHEGLFEPLSSSYHMSPVIYNNQVIVSYTSGQIFSLDAKTGQEVWAINLVDHKDMGLPNFEAVTVACAPVFDGNNMYIASSVNKVLKLDLAAGRVLWESTVSDVQSMTLNGNSIFLTNNAMQLAVLSKNDGKIKWTGNLSVAQQDQRKAKITNFLAPVISKDNDTNAWMVSVITGDGKVFGFKSEGKYLSQTPSVDKTAQYVQYSGMSCCGDFYLVGKQHIILFKETSK